MRSSDFRLLCADLADMLEWVLDSPDPAGLALLARARVELARVEDLANFVASPEEVELHSAPWSYLSPLPVNSPQQSPPLWRMMHAAHFQHADPTAASALRGYAAELRAIADVMTTRMCLLEEDYNLTAPEMIAWLRDEAARAEAGE